MAEKTDEELEQMFVNASDWTPEALAAARSELSRRGIDAAKIVPPPPAWVEGQPMFFPVSPPKLLIMSVVTFGFYQLYWFYKNWEFIQAWHRSKIAPFWRALFGIIFCYQCFREIKAIATSRKMVCSWSAGWLALVWIGLSLSARLPYPIAFLCWLKPLALLPIQYVINDLNIAVAPGHDPNAKLSGWNILAIVVGVCLFLIIFFGSF